ncbi:hypothetical protein OIU78_016519 [Salix suchowensis]|nr:hypothetical protein OIU78_016519 [Salix suchowensis]
MGTDSPAKYMQRDGTVTILWDMFVRFDCVIFSYSSFAVASFNGTCLEWLVLLLDLMAFREQALRLILDLSSTVISLLPHQNSLILHAFMDLFCSFVRVNLISEKIPRKMMLQMYNLLHVMSRNDRDCDFYHRLKLGGIQWRMQSADESMVPLTINCWPSVSGNETFVSIEEPPSVRQIDGEWSGAMEFVVPPVDSSSFFPISVRFSATSTYSELKVVNILPLKGGAPPKFSQRTQLGLTNRGRLYPIWSERD